MNSQVELIRMLPILRVAGLALLAGCGGNTGSSSPAPPPPPLPPLSVTGMDVSPSSVALEPSGVQQFTATVSPSGVNQTVTWSLSGTGCTGESCGTIDATGKYTAPAAGAAVPFFAWVTAVAAANTDWSRSAAVTVSVPTSDNVKLSGRYAVLIRGSVPDEAPQVALVGSFVADGNGNLYAGEGYMSAGISTTGPQRLALANGSYSVGSDNHGTMTLDFVRSDNSHFSINAWFALDSLSPAGVAAHGSLIVPVLGSGTGFLVRQDPEAFSTAAINGDYAFGLMGLGDSFDQENVALGRFTAAGGSLSAGRIDLVGCGISDQPQSDRPFTGTYSVDASGRGGGVATLDISGGSNPLNVVFYVVSSSEMLWMEGRGGTAGTALQQSGGPFSASSSMARRYLAQRTPPRLTSPSALAKSGLTAGEV